MAKKDSSKSRSNKSAKGGKKPFFTRIKNFFSNLFAELKRVVWPDKKKLKQNTGTVLVIIIAAAIMIWVFDTLLNVILTSTGFYAPAPEVSEPVATDPDGDGTGVTVEPTDTDPAGD
ncbi:MAG: preprotein translocase subunit SecE [Eubacteriales bacterium]|nr:preprotein translocase subunit SecE [Eubacteriales bacterium]MDD4541776.1 preprotein translocase subunit SecE [Eubacteriales bacterium]